MQSRQFLSRIKCSQLCGERDIHHAGTHHVFCCFISIKGSKPRPQFTDVKFSVVSRECKNFMPRKFHGSCFVNVDMCRLCTQNTLVGLEHAVDDRGVGLCTTGKEPYLSIWCFAGCANHCPCLFAETVVAIALRPFVVGLHEMAQYRLVSSIIIIAFEMNHLNPIIASCNQTVFSFWCAVTKFQAGLDHHLLDAVVTVHLVEEQTERLDADFLQVLLHKRDSRMRHLRHPV